MKAYIITNLSIDTAVFELTTPSLCADTFRVSLDMSTRSLLTAASRDVLGSVFSIVMFLLQSNTKPREKTKTIREREREQH